MDSFQLSYSDEDREEWPRLGGAPFISEVAAISPPCAKLIHGLGSSTPPSDGWSVEGVSEELLETDALERELDTALWRRRVRLSSSLLPGLFGLGGFHLDRAQLNGCTLPPDLDPKSPERLWAGIQFNGNPAAPVFFREHVLLLDLLSQPHTFHTESRLLPAFCHLQSAAEM